MINPLLASEMTLNELTNFLLLWALLIDDVLGDDGNIIFPPCHDHVIFGERWAAIQIKEGRDIIACLVINISTHAKHIYIYMDQSDKKYIALL